MSTECKATIILFLIYFASFSSLECLILPSLARDFLMYRELFIFYIYFLTMWLCFYSTTPPGQVFV